MKIALKLLALPLFLFGVASRPANADDSDQPTITDDWSHSAATNDSGQPANVNDSSQPKNANKSFQPANVDDSDQSVNANDSSQSTNTIKTSQPANVDDLDQSANADKSSRPANADDSDRSANANKSSQPANADDSDKPATANNLSRSASANDSPQSANADKSSRPAIADSSTYTIIPGDVLQVTVWKEEGLDQEVLVLSDGTINYPLIGSVAAQGKTPSQLQDEIKDKLGKLIPDASVTVAVKAALGHTVSVIGQVTKPGELMLGHGLTVMQALSQAGGLTPYASEGRIIILRRENGEETSIPFPYKDIIDGDALDKDIVLNPGDVVVVPTAGLL